MHSAVMQNADYIKFASQNTVEVIALSRLDEAVSKGDRKAATYLATVDGKKVERMLSWPSLTYDEMIALNQSPAGQYNDTGGIPFTAIVDPYTLEPYKKLSGGQSASRIEEISLELKKQLEKEHGKGMSRKEYAAFAAAENEVAALTEAGEYTKALGKLDAATKNAKNWPQEITPRIDKAREAVIAAATARLDAIEEQAAEDAVAAKRDLDKLALKLRGTGLEQRAKEMAAELAADRDS
jgi:hypothetical protein